MGGMERILRLRKEGRLRMPVCRFKTRRGLSEAAAGLFLESAHHSDPWKWSSV